MNVMISEDFNFAVNNKLYNRKWNIFLVNIFLEDRK